MRRVATLIGSVLRGLGAIWRGQNAFGRALMVIGAVNVTACLFLGANLLLYSALPWRALLTAKDMRAQVPTAQPSTAKRPSPTPRPTLERTPTSEPTATPSPSATPAPTRAPTPVPTRLPTLTPVGRIAVTARMSDDAPKRVSVVTVYGTITMDGVPLGGVPMKAVWGDGKDPAHCDDRSNADGEAACSLPVLLAKKGQYVPVKVTFTYEGKTYTATTGFTPR